LKARDIPNLITVVRIFLVIPTVDAMLDERYGLALLLFVTAGVSDAVDGFLAKYFHWQSRLGSLLDPIADKLLLVSCFIAAGFMSLLSPSLVAAVVLRDVLIVSGASAYYLLLGPFEGEPLLVSKLNTLVQLVLIVAVLADRGLGTVPSAILDLLAVAVFTTTVLSGGMYVYLWGRSYWRKTHE
jgi:cardiolipin synthase (CMP-forming)